MADSIFSNTSLLNLPAWCSSTCTYRFKSCPDDFRVTEVMAFEPSGSGEHCILEVTKWDLPTMDVVRRIARTLNIPARDIGYCGLKDKVAVTTQWLSVPTPVNDTRDWQLTNGDGVDVRFLGRHIKKLRTGVHHGNRFEIVLRDVEGDHEAIEARLNALAGGFPNLFGPQRFGRDYSNLHHFERWQRGSRLKRAAKSMSTSAIRSMAFNQAVASRLMDSGLQIVKPGDWLMWRGSQSVFQSDGSEVDQLRLQQFELDLALPLLDEKVIWNHLVQWGEWPSWQDTIDQYQGSHVHWRRVWATPGNLHWYGHDNDLTLEMDLGVGVYATSLLDAL